MSVINENPFCNQRVLILVYIINKMQTHYNAIEIRRTLLIRTYETLYS